MDIADDSSLFAQQGIEQRGFAHVRRTDDGHRNTLFDSIASLEGCYQLSDSGVDLVGQFVELATVGELQLLVVGEVEFEFDKRRDGQQAFAQVRQLARDTSTELGQRQVFLGFGLCGNEVGYRLGFGEVHLAIEESALGELARLSQLATRIHQPLKERLLDIHAAVACYLYHIFAREGMRGTEDTD